MQLSDLPSEIVTLILEHVTIPDLFQLRLTSRAFVATVSANLSTVAQVTALNTYRHPIRGLLDPPDNGRYSISWLRNTKFKYLSAVLVDRHRFTWLKHPSGLDLGIPAMDPTGDEFRAKITNGWRMLQNLSWLARDPDVAKQVQLRAKRASGRIGNKMKAFLGRPRPVPEMENYTAIEKAVYERRSEYVDRLAQSELQDLYYLLELIPHFFWWDGTRQFAPMMLGSKLTNVSTLPPPFDWGRHANVMSSSGWATWTAWLVMYEGPDLFLTQWSSSLHANSGCDQIVREDMQRQWTSRSAERIAIEREFETKIWYRIVRSGQALEVEKDSLGGAFNLLAHYAQRRFHDQRAGTVNTYDEIMDDIPFLVDFRTNCSDVPGS